MVPVTPSSAKFLTFNQSINHHPQSLAVTRPGSNQSVNIVAALDWKLIVTLGDRDALVVSICS